MQEETLVLAVLSVLTGVPFRINIVVVMHQKFAEFTNAARDDGAPLRLAGRRYMQVVLIYLAPHAESLKVWKLLI